MQEKTNSQWIEHCAHRLIESSGDLSKLSSDERKHFRLLIQEYELDQRLTNLQVQLSQGELPLEE